MSIIDENEPETDIWRLPATAELPGFRPDEMTGCPKCGRKNAPDRPVCLYCGAALQVSTDRGLKISDRLLEAWENGFNVILTEISSEPLHLTDIDGFTAEALRLAENLPKPIAVRRTETAAEAEQLARSLSASGYQALVVSDERIGVTEKPIRIRRLDFTDEGFRLTAFNTGDAFETASSDLRLIVFGTISTGQIETLEKRKRGSAEILDETEFETREMVIDIYSGGEPGKFRICERGFDFGCLGSEKEMVASRNMAKLKDKLLAYAGEERTATFYDEVREVLDIVWPPEIKRETLGMVRSGFARKDLGRKQTVNNLEQFTRYSRMLNYLK